MIYKLRTVDVWDTLIRRRCHPECIKLALAQHVYLRFHAKLRDAGTDAWKLYKQRGEVERQMAANARLRGDDEEYQLNIVVENWLRKVVLLSEVECQASVKELVEAEFSLECQSTFADHGIKDFLAALPAENSIFLSDFYMNSDMLRRLIEQKGLTDLVPDGISSCDIGLNKRSGRLFMYVHKKMNVVPREHIHIGDNLHSDVEMPRSLGIRSERYLPGDANAIRVHYERLFSSRAELFEFLQESSISGFENYREDGDPICSRNAFAAGIKAAPLFIGFVQFIAEQSLKDKVEHIYFQTREGEFFYSVFLNLFPDQKIAGLDLPPASILEVSRLSTFGPSLSECSIDEFKRVWRLLKSQSVVALVKTAGLSIEPFKSVLARCGLSENEIVESPAEDERISKLLCDREFQELIMAGVRSTKVSLLTYLKAQHLSNLRKAAVVDIGWRGTIQDNLALLLPHVHVSGYYLGLQRFLNPQPLNTAKTAYGPDLNISLDWIGLLDAFAPMEMLCNSEKGSVEGYLPVSGGAVATRLIDESENQSYRLFAKDFQRGVIYATQQWQPYLQRYAVSANELKSVAMNIWKGIGETSPDEMAQAFLSSTHNDVFGFGGFLDKRDLPSLKQIVCAAFRRQDRQEVLQYIVRTQWTPAIRHRRDISVCHRLSLISLIHLAKNYKHFRAKYYHLKTRKLINKNKKS